MQRLALAILLVAALVGLVAVLAAGLRKAAGGPGFEDGTTPMQKVAYAVLIALMLYVSIMGAAA
ncbi:MAG: hypothetical protein QNJ13_08365 [Paracoccaceae bacterium]|nr:hypothetical protein [Paracoccaceae bacterium]